LAKSNVGVQLAGFGGIVAILRLDSKYTATLKRARGVENNSQ
jgi:hypothetical protein